MSYYFSHLLVLRSFLCLLHLQLNTWWRAAYF